MSSVFEYSILERTKLTGSYLGKGLYFTDPPFPGMISPFGELGFSRLEQASWMESPLILRRSTRRDIF